MLVSPAKSSQMKKEVIFGVILIIVITSLWAISPIYISYLSEFWGSEKFLDSTNSTNALFAGLALAGIIITIIFQQKELGLQRNELELQRAELSYTREVFKQQIFENTFFSLISFQNQLLNEISVTIEGKYTHQGKSLGSSQAAHKIINGRDFFKHIQHSYYACYGFVKRPFPIVQTLQTPNQFKPKVIETLFEFDISDLTITEIAIKYGLKTNQYSEREITFITIQIINDKYGNDFAHYFYHFYRILKFLKKNEDLELSQIPKQEELKTSQIREKYKDYSKYLFSAMSLSEQFVLFYNSLVNSGMVDMINHFSFLDKIDSSSLISETHKKFYDLEFLTMDFPFIENQG